MISSGMFLQYPAQRNYLVEVLMRLIQPPLLEPEMHHLSHPHSSHRAGQLSQSTQVERELLLQEAAKRFHLRLGRLRDSGRFDSSFPCYDAIFSTSNVNRRGSIAPWSDRTCQPECAAAGKSRWLNQSNVKSDTLPIFSIDEKA